MAFNARFLFKSSACAGFLADRLQKNKCRVVAASPDDAARRRVDLSLPLDQLDHLTLKWETRN